MRYDQYPKLTTESTMNAPPLTEAPTRTRWNILGLLLLISIVTYIDRVNISVTARHMMPALGLTDLQMGQIFSAFVFGYAIFQIPGGWLGDRWGARRVLTCAVLWWSIFTALTAVAPALSIANLIGIMGSLMLVRFLIGVGEAAALPNFNRAVANWHPPHERGRGIGITIGGIGIGSALTPPVTAWIMVNYGWQTAFYAAGALGIAIALLWYWYATDYPRHHRHVNEAEAMLIEGAIDSQDHSSPLIRSSPPSTQPDTGKTLRVPWSSILRTPTVWWLIFSYTCLGYVAYVYMSWFYLYLVNVRGFDVLRGAFFASAPFLAMAVFCPLGGWVTDTVSQARGLNIGRTRVGATGMILASLSIVIGANIASPFLAIAMLSLGAGWLYFTVGAFWAAATDLSKTHAGTLSGMMNTGANLGGTISPTLTPWLAEQFGWTVALGTAALLALVGGILWFLIRPADGLRHQTREQDEIRQHT
ncbi:MAG: MFS transporter [Nitrospirales bacterium]|nr:MAG: MFS transporter [Nitrospirales bacterium]